jgi:hypothetical protein
MNIMDYFKFIAYDHEGKPKLVLKSSEVCLPDVLDDIACFLRGAGFVFDGTIEVVPEEDEEEEEGTFSVYKGLQQMSDVIESLRQALRNGCNRVVIEDATLSPDYARALEALGITITELVDGETSFIIPREGTV